MQLRNAVDADALVLEKLMRAYVQETFGVAWSGSTDSVAHARAQGVLKVVVASDVDRPVAFAAWIRTFDMRQGMAGGEILDLYVSPWDRGRGVAARLVTRVAAEVQRAGGGYLRGQALEDSPVERLYKRVAVPHPGANIHVGGRAFRVLASLENASVREIVSRLPERSWNRQ